MLVNIIKSILRAFYQNSQRRTVFFLFFFSSKLKSLCVYLNLIGDLKWMSPPIGAHHKSGDDQFASRKYETVTINWFTMFYHWTNKLPFRLITTHSTQRHTFSGFFFSSLSQFAISEFFSLVHNCNQFNFLLLHISLLEQILFKYVSFFLLYFSFALFVYSHRLSFQWPLLQCKCMTPNRCMLFY